MCMRCEGTPDRRVRVPPEEDADPSVDVAVLAGEPAQPIRRSSSSRLVRHQAVQIGLQRGRVSPRCPILLAKVSMPQRHVGFGERVANNEVAVLHRSPVDIRVRRIYVRSMNSGDMPPEQLLAWKNQLEARLNEVGQQIGPLLAEHERLRQQIDLVQKLLRLATGTAPEEPIKSAHATSGAQTHVLSDESPVGVIESILRDADGPLHISEISKRYLATGRLIP